MSDEIEVSVVIPACGGAEDTRACLQSLAVQQRAPGFEVVVVDNGCRDHTREMCAEFAGVRVVSLGENLGFAAGANRGIAAATGRYRVVLNNDTMAAPHLLGLLHGAMVRHPDLTAVAPVSNVVKGPACIAVGDRGAAPDGRREIEEELATVPLLQDVESLSGLCLMMHRRTWAETGGFDERFGAGNFEDDDLCLRLRLAGGRLALVRRAFLHHRGHRSFDALGYDYGEQLRLRRRQFEAKWAHDPAGAAWCAWLRGDRGGAARLAAAARTRYPRWVDGVRLRGALAPPAEREALLRQFVGRCPTHPAAVTELAVLMLRRGNRDRAFRWLRRASRHCYFDPDLAAQTMLQLAHGLLDLGDLDTALAVADDGIALGELGAQGAALHNARGAALLRLGRGADSEQAFAEAAAQGCPEARANAGIAAWEQGARARAVALWREILRSEPDHPTARAHLDAVVAAGLCEPG